MLTRRRAAATLSLLLVAALAALAVLVFAFSGAGPAQAQDDDTTTTIVDGGGGANGSEPTNVQVVPGDGELTVSWTLTSREGVNDNEIYHALRWSQEAHVFHNDPMPKHPTYVNNDELTIPPIHGMLIQPGVTSYKITGLKNRVATGVHVRSFTGPNRSQTAVQSSHWVKVKGKDTTPVANEVIFDQADYSVAEGGSVTLGLTRYAIEATSLNTAIEMSLKETSGTATVWADYRSLNSARILDRSMAGKVTTASARIITNDDALVEPDETLKVTISAVWEGVADPSIFGPGNPSTTTITIQDDDRANAKIAFGSDAASTTKHAATVAEAVDGGTLNVPVTVSHLPGASTTFAVEVLSGSTATENSDYSIATKSVTFGPATAKTQNVAITLTDDIDYEADETIELRIVAADATVDDLGDYYARDAAGATATVTVTSADPQKNYALPSSAASVTEGGNTQLTLKLSENAPTGGLAFTVAMTYASGAGKAAAADLSSPPTKVKVAENQQTATLSIPTAADELVEDAETFIVTVTADDAGWSLASGRKNAATVTIADDDRVNARIAFGSDAASATKYAATVAEAGGTLNVPVTVSHLPGASTTFAVEVLSGGTATEGADFSIADKSVTFGPADTSKTKNVVITLTDDSHYEADETIELRIVAADDPGDDLGDYYAREAAGATAAITITSEEPGVFFGTYAGSTTKYATTVAEDVSGGTLNVPVTVNRLPAASATFTVEALAKGTATEGGDYRIAAKSVTFGPATARTQRLAITIIDDTNYEESHETIELRIAAAANPPTVP